MRLVRGKYESGRKVLRQGKLKGGGEIVDTDTFFNWGWFSHAFTEG